MIQRINFIHDEGLPKDDTRRHVAYCFDEENTQTVVKAVSSIELGRRLKRLGVDLNDFETSEPNGQGWKCSYSAWRSGKAGGK